MSNWRARHADFPTAHPGNGRETFDSGEVLAWLRARTIAANRLRPGEDEGLTYADRFIGSFVSQDAVRAKTGTRDRVRRLMDVVGEEPILLDIVVGLVALRVRAPAEFALLRDTEPVDPASWIDRAQLTEFMDVFPRLTPGEADPVRLARLVHRIAEIPLPDPDDRVGRGRLTIRLVNACAAARGRSGDHTVPASLADLMVRVTRAGEAVQIHDPFARAGELLVGAAVRRATENLDAPAVLSADTVNGEMHRSTQAALLLAGLEAEIRTGRMLGRPADNTYDVVLMNPPFGLVVDGLPEHDRRWRYGSPGRSGNFAWLQHAVAMLHEGGRAAVLMAGGAGTTGNPTESRVRAALLEAGVVDAVIALPDRLFASTAIAPSLWLLRSPRATPAPDVLLVDATGMGQIRHGKRLLSDSDVTSIADACIGTGEGRMERSAVPGFSAVIPAADLAQNQDGLNPRAYVGSVVHADARRNTDQVDRARDDRAALLARAHGLGDVSRELLASFESGQELHDDATTKTTIAAVCELRSGPGRLDDSADEPTRTVVVPRGIRLNRIEDAGVVAAAGQAQAKRYRLAKDDVVCVRVGQLGRQGLVRDQQAGWLLGPGCLRIRPGADVDARYLTYYLGTAVAVDWLDRHATGSAIRGFGARVIGDMPLVLPPLAQQRRIGELLDAFDDEADALERASAATVALRFEMAERLIPGIR